jgi:glycosyltransferase involved in cell wall biosynthesis
MEERKIVFVNQAVNFLTVDIVNSFCEKFSHITLITGNVHTQGTPLNEKVKVDKLIKYNEKNFLTKVLTWSAATVQIFFKLMLNYRKHEFFFISVPPMSYLSMLVLRNRFSLLVWDVYPDTLKIFGIGERNLIFKIWASANKRVFKTATNIFTIGDKMAGLIAKYVDREKIKIIRLWTTFPNFTPIDKAENFFIVDHGLQNKFVVQYSGNIGRTHNVEVMVEIAKLLKDNDKIIFLIIGKGERMKQITESIEDTGLKNCMVLPFQPDHVFPYSLSAADMGVVILDSRTSQGSIPNKAYNLMAASQPILYIASKESELNIYAQRYGNGKCFDAGELNEIACFIKQVSEDEDLQILYKRNSLKASGDFSRKNAGAIVEVYN